MATPFPEEIFLEPGVDGVYVPNFDVRPNTAAPIVPYVAPTPPNQYSTPPTTAQPFTSNRTPTDADFSDYGVDEYGRPVVVRDPVTGKGRFNPELGFTPDELDAASRAIDDFPDSKSVRRSLGGIAAAAEQIGDAADLARAC